MEREKPAIFGVKRENLSRYIEIAFYILIILAIISFFVRLFDLYYYHIISPRFGFRKIFLALLFSSLIYLFYTQTARKKFISLFLIGFSIFALMMEIYFPRFIHFSFASPINWIYSFIFYAFLLFLIFLIFWDEKIGLFMTIFSIPFREGIQIGPMVIEPSYFFYIFLSFTLLVFLFKKMQGEKNKNIVQKFHTSGNFEILLIVFLVWNGISAFYAPQYKAAITHLILYFISGFLLYFLLMNMINSSKLLKNLIIILLITGLVASIISLYQYYSKSVFYNPMLVEHNMFSLFGQSFVFRVNSVFWDPNIASKFFIFISILCLCFIFSKLNLREKVLPALTLLLSAIAFVLTFSRSGWICLFISILVVISLWLLFFRSIKIAVVLMTMLLLIAVFTGLYFKESVQYLSNPQLMELERIDRISLLKGGYKIFKEHPLFGIGLRGFPMTYFAAEELGEVGSLLSRESHTTPVTIADELGLIGLALFFWLLFIFIKKSWKGLRNIDNRFLQIVLIGLLGAFTAFFISSLFSAFFFEDHYLWLIFGLALVIPNLAERKEQEKSEGIKIIRKNFVFSLAIFIFIILIIVFYNFFFPLRGILEAKRRPVPDEIVAKSIKIPEKSRKWEYYDDLNHIGQQRPFPQVIYFNGWNTSFYGLSLQPTASGEIIYLLSFDRRIKNAYLYITIWGNNNSVEISPGGEVFVEIIKNRPAVEKTVDITRYVQNSYFIFVRIRATNTEKIEKTILDHIFLYGEQI